MIPSPRSPRKAVLAGLALTAISASGVTALATPAAHAAPAVPAVPPSSPVNGPIAYSVHEGDVNSPMFWHDVSPDGSGDTSVPTGNPNSYNGIGANVPGPGEFGSSDPVFSPDGKRVVFFGGNYCPFLADADGTGAIGIGVGQNPGSTAIDCSETASGHPVPVSASPVKGGNAVWAADSSHLYIQNGDGGPIASVAADGSSESPLPVTVPAGFRLLSAAPNGALVFLDTTLGQSAVAILDPGAVTPRKVTSASNGAALSPDGSRLLVQDFVPSPGGGIETEQLFLVDPTTGSRTQITDTATDNVSSFAWSPDGTQVTYGDNTAQDIYVRPASAGGARTLLVHSSLGLSVSSWHNGAITPPRAADRIGGADRVGTSVAASQWSYANTGAGGRQAKVAVISRSDQFADALGGSALAAEKGGPLLLTPTVSLDPQVAAELTRILAPGAAVYVLGGVNALSPNVQKQIAGLGFSAQRLQGPDRFATSIAVAQAVSPNPHTVMVATGTNFPDALAAGAAAAQDPAGGVVVLSNDAALPAGTKSYLAGFSPSTTRVYGVGGQGVKALSTNFPQWSGSVASLSGPDRYSTAAAVASSVLFTGTGPVGHVGLATGTAWPDALSGGALIATQHGPLLLTNPTSSFLPDPELSVLKALAPHLSGLVAFGGTNAVSSGVWADTAVSGLGANHFFTYANRTSPIVAGPR